MAGLVEKDVVCSLALLEAQKFFCNPKSDAQMKGQDVAANLLAPCSDTILSYRIVDPNDLRTMDFRLDRITVRNDENGMCLDVKRG